MNRDLIAELAGDEPPPPDPERDVVLLLRAAWLLTRHPEYAAATGVGKALRRVRIDLLAFADRLDGARR